MRRHAYTCSGRAESVPELSLCATQSVHAAASRALCAGYQLPGPLCKRTDPISGRADAILKRPATDPKIIHTDTSNEFWQFRASLVGTDADGKQDIADPPNVRRYLFSSTQHGWYKTDVAHYGIGNRQCEQLVNPTHTGVVLRALIVDLEDWVRKGIAPPDSRVPRIGDGSLVSPDRLAFPTIPNVTYTGLYNGSGERDFGPRTHHNAGVIDKLFPDILSTHRILVPQVDRIGNDIAGIRHPWVQVPVATLTGLEHAAARIRRRQLCDLLGSTIPLPQTQQQARAANDPRPSLEALYRDKQDYVDQVTRAAKALEKDRLMLPEDVQEIIREAAGRYPREE